MKYKKTETLEETKASRVVTLGHLFTVQGCDSALKNQTNKQKLN